MSMTKISPDTWALDVRIVKDGHQYRKRETFKGKQTDAEDRLLELKKCIKTRAGQNRSLTSRDIETFGQALQYYHEARKDHLVCPSSFRVMLEDMGGVSLSQLGSRFKSYWLALQRTISRQTGKPLSNSTVNHYTVMAKAALNMCVKDGLLERNPLQHIPILKVTPRDVTLSDIDRLRLVNVVDKEAPHLSAIVRFALAIPSRKAELVALRREDLDLFNMVVRVRHKTAKGDSGSWKPIPPGWLADYFRNLPQDTEHLFFRRNWRGQALSLGDFKRSWNRCLQIADLDDLTFHDTRHISASDLLNAGNPEQVVCQIAGWKSGNMIKQYYHKDGLAAARKLVFPDQKVSTQVVHSFSSAL